MTALTPEAARAAAAAYGAVFGGGGAVSDWFRAEADWLENAAKTPGQVAEYAFRCAQSSGHASTAKCFEVAAAAVIAHHVGPDRVVVDKYLVEQAWETIDNAGRSVLADNLREALS